MVRVDRHPADFGEPGEQGIAFMRDCTAESVDDWVSGAGDFSDALSDALAEARGLCVIHPGGAEAAPAFRRAGRLLVALFEGVAGGGGPAELREDHATRTVRSIGPLTAGHATRWLTAFFLSRIVRDQEMTESLCAVPVSTIRAASPTVDDFVLAWVEVLQRFWRQEAGYGEALVRATRGCDPETVSFMDPQEALLFWYPQLNVFDTLLVGDSAALTVALRDGVQCFREYWTRDAETARLVDGMVAVELLGLACLAHDVGMPIEVESEYLPAALVHHEQARPVD